MSNRILTFALTSTMTKDELFAELADAPGDAIIAASFSQGDRPWESDSASLSARWSTRASSSSSTDPRPHSRACRSIAHDHGELCSRNCPSCGGMELKLKENNDDGV